MGCMGCFLTGLLSGSTKGVSSHITAESLCVPSKHSENSCAQLFFFWKTNSVQKVRDNRCTGVAAQVCASAPVYLVIATGECQPALPPPALQPQTKKFGQRNAQIPLCKIPGSWGFVFRFIVPPGQIPCSHRSSTFHLNSCWWLKPQGLIGWMRPPPHCCVWGQLLWEPGASLPCRGQGQILGGLASQLEQKMVTSALIPSQCHNTGRKIISPDAVVIHVNISSSTNFFNHWRGFANI